MKRFLFTLLLAVLLALPFSLSFGQDSSKVTAFVGPEFDSGSDETRVVAGVSTRLLGIAVIGRTTIGEYGSLEFDGAKFFDLSDKVSFGLMAGPSLDYVNNGSPVSYLVASSGAIFSWKSKAKGTFGFSAAAKYKFTVTDGTAYQDGWNGGIYLTYGL